MENAGNCMTTWKKIVAVCAAAVVVAGIAYDESPGVRRRSAVVAYRLRAAVVPVSGNKTAVRLDVPFHRQEHALSCEIATLKMVLNYYGDSVTEEELLRALPFDTREPRGAGNVWGDPDRGFVGNIDGRMPKTGYGVYEGPIADLALRYRPADALRGTSLERILEEVSRGHPVIVWGAIGAGRDISWNTPDGKDIKAVYGEHTRVVVGFTGKSSEPKTILLLDPIYGRLTMSAKKFSTNWSLLGNRAVIVYK